MAYHRVCMSKYARFGRSDTVTNVEIVAGLEASAGEAVTVPRITPLWLGTTGSGVVRGGSLASRATPECCDPRFC